MACVHTQKIPSFPQWKQCTVSKLHAWWFAKKSTFKSRQEKYAVPTMLSMASWIWGSGKGSFLVLALSLWKSVKKCRPPSFLYTSTTALHHGLWLGQIVPTSNIFMCAWTSSTIKGGILQNLSLKGLSSKTLISCFAKSVQTNSPGSKERMSIHSANRAWAAIWLLSDHLSRPDKSSCWKRNFLLCSTVILFCWIHCISSNFSRVFEVSFTGLLHLQQPLAWFLCPCQWWLRQLSGFSLLLHLTCSQKSLLCRYSSQSSHEASRVHHPFSGIELLHVFCSLEAVFSFGHVLFWMKKYPPLPSWLFWLSH